MKISLIKRIAALGVFLVLSLHTSGATAQPAPTITKEQLLDMLDLPDLVIIDVRTTGNWQGSDHKIKGARRGIPENFDAWSTEYSKDKILVLY